MTDELKGFEPVATVRIWNESNFCKDRWVYEFVGEKFENFGAGEYKLYTADQLAAVVQQRDELLAAAISAHQYAVGNAWDQRAAHILYDAITKVKS